ncbi:MAG: protein kinase [Candidatus Krumholzibacteriia bacterium]
MIGSEIGHYRLEERLGRGAMGEVYLAQDLTLRRRVAIKFLLAGEQECPPERLGLEARAAAALNHPNVCTVHELGEHEGQPYLVLEHVEGRTLRNLLEDGPLSLPDVLDIGGQMIAGLAAAHAAGIVHRDIKPENVMITPDGVIKLMDFGLAGTRAGSLAIPPGHIAGTIAYMAPEVLRGEPATPRSDLWSLGVTLHEMSTGERVFRGTQAAAIIHEILTRDPPRLTEGSGGDGSQIGRLVDVVLARDPAARPADAVSLQAWLRSETPTVQIGPAAVPVSRWIGRRALLATLAVAGLAFAIVLRVLLGGGPSGPVLAVADLRDLDGGSDAVLAAGLTELLATGLTEAVPGRLISREHLQEIARRRFGDAEAPLAAERALAVAREAGATHLLAGNLALLDDRRVVAWRLIDVREGSNLAAHQEEGESWTALADRVIAGVVPVLAGLGGGRPARPAVPVARLTTSSQAALRSYLEGRLALRSEQYAQAREALAHAVELDSTFAIAQLALSRFHDNVIGGLGDPQLTRKHALAAWRHRERLSRKDRLRVESWVAKLEYRLADARAIFAELRREWPDDRDALLEEIEFLYHHGYFADVRRAVAEALRYYRDDDVLLDYQQEALAALGDAEGALATARECVRLAPRDVARWHELAARWLDVAEPDSAEAAVRRALELDPGFLLARIQLARCDYARGDLAAAVTRLEELARDERLAAGDRIRVLTSSSYRPSLAMLYGEQGRLGDAQAAFDSAVAWSEAAGLRLAIEGRRMRFLLAAGKHEPVLAWAGAVLADSAGRSAWFNAKHNEALALARAGSVSAAEAAAAELDAAEAAVGGLARYFARRARLAAREAAGDPAGVLTIVGQIREAGWAPGGAFEIEVLDAEIAALQALGRTAAAERALRELLARHGGHTTAAMALGDVLRARNRREEASQWYGRALDLWAHADLDFAPADSARLRLAALNRPH